MELEVYLDGATDQILDIKSVGIGILSDLTTNNKDNLVAAINETNLIFSDSDSGKIIITRGGN